MNQHKETERPPSKLFPDTDTTHHKDDNLGMVIQDVDNPDAWVASDSPIDGRMWV